MLGGPYGTPVPGDSPIRRHVFGCTPQDRAAEEPCARKIFSSLATRAYRRPATEDDLRTLMGFYKAGRAEGSFDEGIRRGLERMLAAPSFLFRVEREARPPTSSAYQLGDLDLASRLSFFLWSMTDQELLATATRERCRIRRAEHGRPAARPPLQRWSTTAPADARVIKLRAVPDTELYSDDETFARVDMIRSGLSPPDPENAGPGC